MPRRKKQVSESVVPIIEGKIADGNCRSGGIPFTNLDPLTDGTLKPGKADIYHGARVEQLSRKVRDELGGQIILSTQDDLPIAPNFFLAAKELDGSASVAKRQCCYNGALREREVCTVCSHTDRANQFTTTMHLPLRRFITMASSRCIQATLRNQKALEAVLNTT